VKINKTDVILLLNSNGNFMEKTLKIIICSIVFLLVFNPVYSDKDDDKYYFSGKYYVESTGIFDVIYGPEEDKLIILINKMAFSDAKTIKQMRAMPLRVLGLYKSEENSGNDEQNKKIDLLARISFKKTNKVEINLSKEQHDKYDGVVIEMDKGEPCEGTFSNYAKMPSKENHDAENEYYKNIDNSEPIDYYDKMIEKDLEDSN